MSLNYATRCGVWDAGQKCSGSFQENVKKTRLTKSPSSEKRKRICSRPLVFTSVALVIRCCYKLRHAVNARVRLLASVEKRRLNTTFAIRCNLTLSFVANCGRKLTFPWRFARARASDCMHWSRSHARVLQQQQPEVIKRPIIKLSDRAWIYFLQLISGVHIMSFIPSTNIHVLCIRFTNTSI